MKKKLINLFNRIFTDKYDVIILEVPKGLHVNRIVRQEGYILIEVNE